MKYIVTFFWSFILGQIVYYLGSSLTRAQYDLVGGTILAFVITIVVALVASKPTAPKLKQAKKHIPNSLYQ